MRLTRVLLRGAASPQSSAKSPMPLLVVYGLGNLPLPTAKHSLGQYMLDALMERCMAESLTRQTPTCWTRDDTLLGLTASVQWQHAGTAAAGPETVLFVKSKLPMNGSGQTAKALLKRYPDLIRDRRLLVVHDELSIKAQIGRGQFAGAAKGHNGIRDIIDKLKTSDFHRFRAGIGRPEDNEDSGSSRKQLHPDIATWCLSPLMRAELEACNVHGRVTAACYQYMQTILQENDKKN